MKRREIRVIKKTCTFCQKRKARVRRGNRVIWDRRYPLCFQCARSTQDRARSVALAHERAICDVPRFAREVPPPTIEASSLIAVSLKPQLSQCFSPIGPGYPSHSLFSLDAQKSPVAVHFCKSLIQEAK